MSTPTTPDLLTAALAYAARGWRVFPCCTPTTHGCSCRKPGCENIGKHPRTQHGLKDASTDAATIRRWWQMCPDANIGIATGAGSGVVVLDNDSYKGGDSTLHDLEQSYRPLPETVLSLTGGGGEQYFFAHPGTSVKNGVESLGIGLDIRGDGGYVIAPPSLHKSGKRYAWEVVHEPDDTPLAPMPDWLLALCQETKSREVVDASEPIPKGTRNDTLFRHGCRMRRQGFSAAVILAALREMNQTQCDPPLAAADVEKIAASCAKYEAGSLPSANAHQDRNGHAKPAPAPEDPLPYSDYTNARAFVQDHGQNLRFCFPWKTWLVWTGTHWQRDTSGTVLRLAKQTVKRLARHVADLDDDRAKALMAHIKTSLAQSKLKAMVECAQSEEGIPAQPEVFDADVWMLNCANGTLDLRTGELRPHRQDDMLTKCLAIPYDPEALCETWNTFLWRIMGGSQGDDNPDMSVAELAQRQAADERATALIAYLQRSAGYTLTGSTKEQCLFLCHGPTKTGKSTYLATMRNLLGPYGKQTDMATFMHKDRPEVRNDLADLAGARYVYAVESQEGKRLAEGLVKQMTGGVDHIKARFLFQEYFEFAPQFKAYIGTNHLPVIKDSDDAIWERIRRIPFTVQIPKEQRNKDLEADLLRELPGILAWAVRGCAEWRRLNDLKEPDVVVVATQEYRHEMDDVGRFLQGACLLGQGHYKTQASQLLKAYHQWCGQTTMTGKTLASILEKKGYASKRSGSGNFWQGIGLPSDAYTV